MSDAIRRLRELEQAATPGPWWEADQIIWVEIEGQSLGEMDAPNDARLVPAARNMLPLLLNIAEAAIRYRQAELQRGSLVDPYIAMSAGYAIDASLAAFDAAYTDKGEV